MSTMKTTPFVKALLAAMLSIAFVPAQVAAVPTALNIAQKPIFLGGTDPNVMFLLDGSGSMSWSYLPDNIGRRALNATDSTLNGMTNDGATSCLGLNAAGWRKALTWSGYNKIYYDPAITYLPPMNADNTVKANSTWPTAPNDGFGLITGSTNLSTSYIASWGHASNKSNTDVGSKCATINVSATGAYYNKLTGTAAACTAAIDTSLPPPPDSCFTTVTVSATSGPGGTDERVNFANWYSYYRTRINVAKTGVSRAFAQAGTGMYMGYGILNNASKTTDGVSNLPTIERGVRPFQNAYPNTTDTYRTQFFTWLFNRPAGGGTPLRGALRDAGRYYAESNAAYSSKPWDGANGNAVSCRQSYSILMTDGYWRAETAPTPGNADGTNGSTITGTSAGGTSLSYQYTAKDPFKDNNSNTLADVAMHYWKNDLRSDRTNNVPTTNSDPAFWQHMVTFGIGLGVSGSVDPTTAFNAINTGTAISWGTPSDTGTTANVNDLLHAAVNSRGGFFSAQNPQQFAEALSSTLSTITSRKSSGGSVAASSGRMTTDTLYYQTSFDSSTWSGDVKGYTIDPATNNFTLAATASSKIGAHGTRSIYTWKPTSNTGTPTVPGTATTFTAANLSSAQTTAISTGKDSSHANLDSSISVADIVAYVRGDKSKEVSNGGILRNRSGTIGDIINSSVIYTNKDDFGFSTAASLSTAARNSYLAFVASRTPMLYVGANDGMLHAFDGSAGSSALSETFAYVPHAVMGNLPYLAKNIDFNHKYFVDATFNVSHAYLGGSWKSILVGSTGAGGKSYFAIDVTTPNSPQVLWEFMHDDLGYTIGQASIVRMPNGVWAAVFGNGYSSTNGTASLFIVNLETGALMTSAPIPVTSRDTNLSNGLSTPTLVDVDRDGTADLAYAGDLQGQMWKFNLSSATPSSWNVGFAGKPLFQTAVNTDSSNSLTRAQPITARPVVSKHPSGGVIVVFGTGKYMETGDQSFDNLQTIYGIRDICVLSTASSCSASGSAKVTVSELVKQTFTTSTQTYTNTTTGQSYTETIRKLSKNAVPSTKMGYYLPLQENGSSALTGERIVSAPVLWPDRVFLASIVPNQDVCGNGGDTWQWQINLLTGGETTFTAYDLNRDGVFAGTENANAYRQSGVLTGTTSTSYRDAKSSGQITGGGGGTSDSEFKPNAGPNTNNARNYGRQSWRQIR